MAATHLVEPKLWPAADASPPAPARWMMHSPETAEQLFLRESFRLPPRTRRAPAPAFSRAWFETIERQRYSRQGRWIPRVLEFGRHSGETLLALGAGLGTDWLQFAKNGARVVVCSSDREQLDLTERHFRLRDCPGQFAFAPPTALPFEAATIDVVCIQGLLHQVAQPGRVIDEVYRVLRPGGKVMVVAPARYNARFWQERLLPWRRWFRNSTPPTGETTGRDLKRDFAQFVDHVVKKRHLRRSHLPQIWRPFPLPVLERFLGQFLILKAFKPVSAALGDLAAA